MGAMYKKGQTKRYSRVASFEKSGKSNKASGDSERKRISRLAKEGDIDEASDRLMKMRDAEMRGPSKSVKRDMVRKIRDVVMGGGMPPMGMPPMGMPPPMNPMVPGMKGMPMMKNGGKVKESKAMMAKGKGYAVGGKPTVPMQRRPKTKQVPKPAGRRGLPDFVTPDMLRPPNAGGVLRYTAEQRKRVNALPLAQRTRIMALRAGKAKPMPPPAYKRPGTNPEIKQVPPPAYKRPGTNPKTKQMPRPGMNPKMAATMAKMATKGAGMGLGPRGKMNPRMAAMAAKAGLKGAGVFKHGGDVYTTPGGPTRGKSGKIKKMAAGGMIPKEGKKSPNSMGTSYRGGGAIDGGAIDGCAVKGRTRAKRIK
jgi:hypothetical protein